jgi:hypothetical protein
MAGPNPGKLRKEERMKNIDNMCKSFFEAGHKKGLMCGIAYAAGILNKFYDDQSAKFIIKESGIKSKKELREAGCDNFDLDNLGNLLPEK